MTDLTAPSLATTLADPASVPFSDCAITTADGTYGHQVFIPPDWNRRRRWPVILFLHGAGPRGDDNRQQSRTGIRRLIARDLDRFPAIVICPQCRTDARWTRPDMERMVLGALDQVLHEFRGDPRRVYLTSLSLGGYGTWELARRHPDRWAALAPCCGGVLWRGEWRDGLPDSSGEAVPADPYRAVAEAVASIPTWAFHGQHDSVVPVSESRQMVAVLCALGASVRYTEYPGVDHDSWDRAYAEPGLLAWLLSHRRGKSRW